MAESFSPCQPSKWSLVHCTELGKRLRLQGPMSRMDCEWQREQSRGWRAHFHCHPRQSATNAGIFGGMGRIVTFVFSAIAETYEGTAIPARASNFYSIAIRLCPEASRLPSVRCQWAGPIHSGKTLSFCVDRSCVGGPALPLHHAFAAPFARMCAPETQLACGDARKATTAATSSARPIRWNGDAF